MEENTVGNFSFEQRTRRAHAVSAEGGEGLADN